MRYLFPKMDGKWAGLKCLKCCIEMMQCLPLLICWRRISSSFGLEIWDLQMKKIQRYLELIGKPQNNSRLKGWFEDNVLQLACLWKSLDLMFDHPEGTQDVWYLPMRSQLISLSMPTYFVYWMSFMLRIYIGVVKRKCKLFHHEIQ